MRVNNHGDVDSYYAATAEYVDTIRATYEPELAEQSFVGIKRSGVVH